MRYSGANVALNSLLDSNEPLPSPAKKFVKHLTRSVIRLHTRNTIIEQENADQKVILQGRKRQLSGKRRVIHGKHLMTAAELIGVREAEELTKQKKIVSKRGTGKRKGKSKAENESSDESDVYVDIPDDEVELLECIEVEM